MGSGVAKIPQFDHSSVVTPHQEHINTNGNNQLLANQTLPSVDGGFSSITMHPVAGEISNTNEESRSTVAHTFCASQDSDIPEGLRRIFSLPGGPEDPEVYEAITQWISSGINETGTNALRDATDTIDFLDSLGNAFFRVYHAGSNILALNLSILARSQAVYLSDKHDTSLPARLLSLGKLLLHRAALVDPVLDSDRAIEYLTRASLTNQGEHTFQFNVSRALWEAHIKRFERVGTLDDLSLAIMHQDRVLVLAGDKHEAYAQFLAQLGSLYFQRYEALGGAEDVSRAIEYQTKLLHFAPCEDEDKADALINLGNSYLRRFEYLGEMTDINSAIDCQAQAVRLTPEGYADLPSLYNSLGSSYNRRFERLGELEDISKAIEHKTKAIQLAPGGHVHMPNWYSSLGISYKSRFGRFGEMEDLDSAIQFQTRAVELTPEGHPDMAALYNNLGCSCSCRFECLGELKDISRAIVCHTKAVQLTPEGHANMPSRYNNLGISYQYRFDRLGEMNDCNKAIDCHTQAVQLTPDGHANMPACLNNLSISYQSRFERLGELEDINRAIGRQIQAVQLTPEGHVCMPRWYNNLGKSYRSRFERLGEMKDINGAIQFQMRAIQLTPDGHMDMASWHNNLGCSYQSRFDRSGELEDINKAINCMIQAVQLTPEGHADMPSSYNNLGSSYRNRFSRRGEIEDLNKATECLNQAIILIPDEHADKHALIHNLGLTLQLRFENLKDPGDLHKSIEVYTQALHLLPQGHHQIPTVHYALGQSYLASLQYSNRPEDPVAALQNFEIAARSPIGSPDVRFHASRKWATLDGPGPLQAHSTMMGLLPQIVWLGTTVGRRYESVDEIGAVAVGAAAAAVSAKEYGLALEWLEEGRSIVWNQILQLRTPIDALAKTNPPLAQRLQNVSKRLEQASSRVGDTVPLGPNTIALEQVTLLHHRLVGEFNELIDHARHLPGFHDFMRPRKAADIMPAAHRGPVVVVNVSTIRSDALILRPGSDEVAHLSLINLSHDGVAQLHSLMMQTLKANGIRERTMSRYKGQPGDQFEDILSALWSKLVKPVLEFLGYTNKHPVDQLPHITWCTTGALSFLPIHAAGIYHPGGDRIFEFAITSYTPTLGALLSLPSEPCTAPVGVLAVGQESTPGLSKLPGTKDELVHIKRHVEGLPYRQLEGSQATTTAVLDAMDQYECVHLACHASQNTDDPTKSCFHLHDGTLSLEKIAQRSLKNKSLAFLSACQTAAGDQKKPDEAIHLAAGMLVAGYPSVIATMWSIRDKSAPFVADNVYDQLIQEGKLDCTRAARALHTAVSALRAKVGEKKFAVWVPYIHIGA